jgi:hypothetical protein
MHGSAINCGRLLGQFDQFEADIAQVGVEEGAPQALSKGEA